MSGYGAIIASTAATTAAIAAAEKQKKEEEDMAGYNKADLDGWEFKILRSPFGKYSNHEKVKQACDEEARAGWELVEKFDDHRLRFKRRVEKRSSDSHLDFDPYRTNSGGGAMAAVVIGIVLLVAGAAIFAVLAVR